ncbi:guanylate kinase [Anaplasma ovis str. Haibei]|uniref:Guanylate kinase n=1 Tax=Anaplasma ovis str. Haibei TaxID=1248439 RepID=A0A2Z2LF09_9RICK|nr:guanylate kinase [Anaplasma ovis str. Haibei]
MLVISSPSGCGKTTVSDLVIKNSDNNVIRSVSATTRAPRKGEVDGRDYFFLSETEFLLLCKSGEMLEHAKVFGNYYGIPRKFVEENVSSGKNILFVIDWQGAFRLMEVMKELVVSVFIVPPSMDELRRRLHNRSGGDDVARERLASAPFEISHCYRYDYVIVNESAEETARKISCIIGAESMRASRQSGLKKLIDGSFSL